MTEDDSNHDCRDHMEWITDWEGDPGVIHGVNDCSHWRCKKCGEEDYRTPGPKRKSAEPE